MNKKLFDRKLYAEGIRQTRLMGIIFAVATIGISALIPMANYFQYWNMDEAAKASATKSPIDVVSVAPVLILFMYLAPFVLTVMQFGFLNKRNASDYYHSIPNTRTSLFSTFSAVTATWITGIIAVSTLISSLLYAICPITAINLTFIPYTLFTYLAGALLVFAATILGMSITGTGITNFVVTGLILFFPRLITIVFSQVINGILLITTSADFGIFTDTKYNIAVSFIFSLFKSSSSDLLNSVGAIVYTAVIALLYFTLAWFFFKKRKSESAEKSAPNKVLQHVYRCLITIPVSLIIPSILVSDGIDSRSRITPMLIAGLITLIIYYAYEIITTKKVSNLLKATPVLLAVIAFDVIFALSMLLTKNAVLSVKPSASEIDSVYLNTLAEEQSRQFSYNQRLLQNVKFTDETMKQLVSDSLKETIAAVEYGNNSFYQYASNRVQRTVTFEKKNGGKFKRLIIFKKDDYNKITELQLGSASFVKAATELPELKSGAKVSFSTLSEKDALKLWDIYKAEWEGLSFAQKTSLNEVNAAEIHASTPDMDPGVYLGECINITGYHGFEQYSSYFYINNFTPKTRKAAIEMVNGTQKQEIEKLFSDVFNEKYASVSLNMSRLKPTENAKFDNIYYNLTYGQPQENDFTKEEIQKVTDTLKAALENPIDNNKLFHLDINFGIQSKTGYQNQSYRYYFSLTDEQEAVLSELSVNYKQKKY